jgi:hypothetical protein
MKHIKLLAITVMAILSLTALIATTAAFAEEAGAPLINPNPTREAPLRFTSRSGVGILEGMSEISKLTCRADTNSGSFTTGRSGTVTIDFTECTGEEGAARCRSLGDPTGTILTGGPIKLVDQNLGGRLLPAIIIELERLLHIECGAAGLLILSLGNVIGLITRIDGVAIVDPAEGTTKEQEVRETVTVAFTREAGRPGEQSSKKCALPKETCEGREFLLKVRFTTEEELASEETEDVITFARAAKLLW